MKFVVAAISVMFVTLLLQSLAYASRNSSQASPTTVPPQTAPLNYTPIFLPGVQPLPTPAPNLAPPIGPINPSGEDDGEDTPPDPEDSGSTDELDVTEAGTVCTSPECLSQVNFSPIGTRAEGINDVAASTLQYAFTMYSNSEVVDEMIAQARAHIAANPRAYIKRVKVRGRWVTRTLCYRAVKDAMRDSNMVSSDFAGTVHARDAGDDLEILRSQEFVNLMDNPEVRSLLEDNPAMAPRGTILVYENTNPNVEPPSKSGHVEIKTTDAGTHGYISISESSTPTYGFPIPSVRRLTGVYYRRDLASDPQLTPSAPAPR